MPRTEPEKHRLDEDVAGVWIAFYHPPEPAAHAGEEDRDADDGDGRDGGGGVALISSKTEVSRAISRRSQPRIVCGSTAENVTSCERAGPTRAVARGGS